MVLHCIDDAPTAGDRGAAAGVRGIPVLLGYRPSSSPPLAENLLDKPRRRAHWFKQLPIFCRRRTGEVAGDMPDGGAALAVDWGSVARACAEWVKNPMNIALLLWLLCVGVAGGMLVLLLLGLLDGAFPAPAARNRWIEINNQLLNALFTLMSVYQHPALCHHLFLLCRWRPADAAELRAAYCKGGAAAVAAASPRPGERAHLAVVVALLHLTVLCQYGLCGLYWGYTRSTRPELAEDGLFVLGVVAPLAAVVYTVRSPLGKSLPCELAVALPGATQPCAAGHVVVVEPEWAGGMFDCGGAGGAGDAAATACLSLSCTFCVFGWNMERLGLGNACVHAATFALLCVAPLWVLGVSALHIHDRAVGDAAGAAGVLLCAGGLLYGGYWRIQARRRFGLPASAACCGSESLTDYARWLFCWPCALAQEVRTASRYLVAGETFYSKVVAGGGGDGDGDREERQPLLVCNRHDVVSAPDTIVAVAQGDRLVVVDDETTMAPPDVQVVVVQVEGDEHEQCSVGHGEVSDLSILPVSTSETAMLEDEYLVQEEDEVSLSDGGWKVEKVKKMINMVTLLSLLILLYTRGFLR
ncbi:hypothetical protein ACP4OV_003364 [Aristida adscensionis]